MRRVLQLLLLPAAIGTENVNFDSTSLFQSRHVVASGLAPEQRARSHRGDGPYAWTATPYGGCIQECNSSRFRNISCSTIFDARPVPDKHCPPEIPPSAADCTCGGLEVCHELPAGTSCPPIDHGTGHEVGGFEEVGCFEFAETGRVVGTSPEQDNTCMGWTSAEPCMGGLPFYAVNLTTPQACYGFCISKGMDIFGIESRSVCRCGASLLNAEVWHEELPRKGLFFSLAALTRAVSQGDGCPMRIYHYTGHYEDDGVPSDLWDITEGDLEYVDSLAKGREVGEGTEEDGLPELEMEMGDGVDANSAQQRTGQTPTNNYDRPCWPGQCGPGRGPWQDRSDYPLKGVADDWKDYVLVKYGFEVDVDDGRRSAFRVAVDRIRAKTCINLVEQATFPWGPHIKVGIYDEKTCYLQGMGTGTSKLNLGWCNSMRHVGNMVHEIGHALGMNHEQKRPDATMAYQGHGPFLSMHWENIPSRWLPQYTPALNSYTGSANDGPQDPQVGFADYNFDSVMHYPRSNRYDTIPASKNSVLGNRQKLADGDVVQLNDMYQCHPRCSGGICHTRDPTPSPTPAPTPVPTPPTPAPVIHHELRVHGRCTTYVLTIEDCAAAAVELGVPDTTPTDDGQWGVSYDPPYCYYEAGSLKFNSNGQNSGDCSLADTCLCYIGPTLAPTPAPPLPPLTETYCSFEDGSQPYCGIWEDVGLDVDTFDWSRRSGGTPTSETGPPGAKDGACYLFIESSSPRSPGDTAVLRSRDLSLTPGTVLHFSYHMRGSSIGTLRVQENGKDVWSRTGEQGSEWLDASVGLTGGDQTRVEFVGIRGSGYKGDLAIDNVSFTEGAPLGAPTPMPTAMPTAVPTQQPTPAPTQQPTAIPTQQPTPQPTAQPTQQPTPQPTPVPTAIPTQQPTSTLQPVPASTPPTTSAPHPTQPPATPQPVPTTTPLPTQAPLSLTNCSFEDANKPYCGLWSDAASGDLEWIRRSGSTPSVGTGPGEAADGAYYLYMEASNPARPGDHAVLTSGNVSVPPGTVLQFSYHMRGWGIGSLEVLEGSSLLWRRTGHQHNSWITAGVTFSGGTQEISVVATRGVWWQGDIGIDGLMFYVPHAPQEAANASNLSSSVTTTLPVAEH